MFTRLAFRATSAIERVLVLLVTALRGRTTHARAAGFIEYAMLAVIAVAIGFVFREALGNAFDNVLARITSGLQVR